MDDRGKLVACAARVVADQRIIATLIAALKERAAPDPASLAAALGGVLSVEMSRTREALVSAGEHLEVAQQAYREEFASAIDQIREALR